MHRQMCVTRSERDCRRGGRGACRACPYRKGGALHQTPEQAHESLVKSWFHHVISGAGPIQNVPWESCGRSLQPVVRARVERRYRSLARRISDEQNETVRRMRRRAPNDIAEATGLSVDDVYLWLLGLRRQSSTPFYSQPLKLGRPERNVALELPCPDSASPGGLSAVAGRRDLARRGSGSAGATGALAEDE